MAEEVGASFRYPRRTIHGTIGRMSTLIIAIVCALGVIVPLALGFLPSQRKRRATRRWFAQPRWLAQGRAGDPGRDAYPLRYRLIIRTAVSVTIITSTRANGATTASVCRAYALGSSSGPGYYPGSIATHQLKASPMTRDSWGVFSV
ncbi:hypothetical protein FOB82_09815 [Corynebacterium xerosis]|uniref:Uncharacterized protein n=1 Tax=Corynebacterium xerosis TaxID=1725 RepID=A0A6B8TK07_9CORY|nr:hypothetical protein [Corynebacterium xerosis]QGS35189.1 hypothetical protein FOB82_09815 [Corynebacterium xerosis]